MSDPSINRKDQILGKLHTRLRARTHRRRITRVSASTAGLLALCAIAYFAIPPALQPPTSTTLTHKPTPPEPPLPHITPPLNPSSNPALAATKPSRVTVRIAKSEPLPTTPCEANSSATVCILTDDQLLAALAEAGQPSGLVRTGGETFVVPNGTSIQPRPRTPHMPDSR